MAVNEEIKKRTARILLNNGVSQTGKVLTVNANYATLEPSRWDPQKAMNIKNAAEDIFSPAIEGLETVVTSGLYDE